MSEGYVRIAWGSSFLLRLTPNTLVSYQLAGLQQSQQIVRISGFNQRQGEALPPQIFLTLSRFVFTVPTRKIGTVYSQENYRNCCQMSDFKAKKHQIRFRLGIRPRPH